MRLLQRIIVAIMKGEIIVEDIVKARLKFCRRDAAGSVKGGNVMAEGTFKCVGHCILLLVQLLYRSSDFMLLPAACTTS